MSKDYRGISFEEMADIEAGDSIHLADRGLNLMVTSRTPSVRQGGRVVQRSALVKIEGGVQAHDKFRNQSVVLLMVTNDTPNRVTLEPV